jgi:hypothetical protein
VSKVEKRERERERERKRERRGKYSLKLLKQNSPQDFLTSHFSLT